MRKRVIGFISAFVLVAMMPFSAQAEEISGGDGWSVTFNGSKMESTFKNADIDDAIYQLQPGDTVNIHLTLQNKYNGDTDWYMTNQVLQSLEETQSVAEGGVYTYQLTYTAPDGKETVLYDSADIGGDAGKDALKKATKTLEDYFYLDQLGSGEKAEIKLLVHLEGETQGNTYQDTMAKLQMNFAVEMVKGNTTKTVNKNRVVKTGDQSNAFFFTIVAFVAGGVCLIVAVYKLWGKSKQNGQHRKRGAK